MISSGHLLCVVVSQDGAFLRKLFTRESQTFFTAVYLQDHVELEEQCSITLADKSGAVVCQVEFTVSSIASTAAAIYDDPLKLFFSRSLLGV